MGGHDELARRDAHLTMTYGETMAQHEHGLRFVDDGGRCLACALAVSRVALGEAAEALEAAEAFRQASEAIDNWPGCQGDDATEDEYVKALAGHDDAQGRYEELRDAALANPVTAAALADRRKAGTA